MLQKEESYYSIFLGLVSITDERTEEQFEATYYVIIAILILLGVVGMALNGWALYLFCKTKTVSIYVLLMRAK